LYKEIGLEVNTDQTTNVVMSRDKNARRIRSMKTDNSSFERMEQFRYLGGKNLTDKNSNQEETKYKLNSGNACYHSVQKL